MLATGLETPRIEVVTPGDLEALAVLETRTFPADESWSREQLRGTLEAPGLHLLARRGPAVEAFALFLTAADEAELLRIGVDPTYRRRGLAATLLRHGLESLARGGIRRCLLEVREDNSPARALYRRAGFRPVGRRRRYYPDGVDAVLYDRSLDAAGSP